LDCISGSQSVPKEQGLGVTGQFWGQFYQNKGSEIGIQPSDGAITLRYCEGPFAYAACEC
jgi:hypothetical protein